MTLLNIFCGSFTFNLSDFFMINTDQLVKHMNTEYVLLPADH